MSLAMSPTDHEPADGSAPYGRAGLMALLALWLLTILTLTATGVMDPGPGNPPIPILISVAIPVLLFFGTYGALPRFKAMVLGADLRVITAIQAWRTLGLGFILLHLNGLLPGLFAWPAGLGDATIAMVAPWVVYRLLKDPGFVASNRFLWWNWLGLFDFAVAIALGAATSGAIPALVSSGVTSAAVSTMPLALIPGFFVPVFMLLHFTALLQAAAARRQ